MPLSEQRLDDKASITRHVDRYWQPGQDAAPVDSEVSTTPWCNGLVSSLELSVGAKHWTHLRPVKEWQS